MKKTLLLCVTLLSVNVLYSMDKNGQQDDVVEMMKNMMLDSNANASLHATNQANHNNEDRLAADSASNLYAHQLQKNAELMAQIAQYFPDISRPKDLPSLLNDHNTLKKILAALSQLDEPAKNSESQHSNTNNTAGSSSHAIAAASPATAPAILYSPCYFANDIKGVFLNCIHNEQEALHGAWYRFTLYDAAQAIVQGIQKRNIAAKLIVDEQHITDDFCSPLKQIIDNGGSVFKKNKMRHANNPGKFEIMHHKFMIFRRNLNDKKLLWTGSWNATGQASLKNCENVTIIDDPKAIAKFEKEFADIEQLSTQLTSGQCVSRKDSDSSINFARRMNGIPQIN